MVYIHPDLRISNCRFRLGKEQCRFRGSIEGARGGTGGAVRSTEGRICYVVVGYNCLSYLFPQYCCVAQPPATFTLIPEALLSQSDLVAYNRVTARLCTLLINAAVPSIL